MKPAKMIFLTLTPLTGTLRATPEKAVIALLAMPQLES